MKKTQTAPANPSGGNQPEVQKRKLRPVYLTDARWDALKKTGNASHALNKLCDVAGYPEQPITDKIKTQ